MDHLQEWFSEVRERLTRTLDDKSFEHDTQASTGSTTGDWFILLYVFLPESIMISMVCVFAFSKKSNESRNLIPTWEATSLQ